MTTSQTKFYRHSKFYTKCVCYWLPEIFCTIYKKSEAVI